MPFDELHYAACIRRLGGVIAQFMQANDGCPFVSFVEDAGGRRSTHSHRLQIATRRSGIGVEAYAKRPAARQSPYAHIAAVLGGTTAVEGVA